MGSEETDTETFRDSPKDTQTEGKSPYPLSSRKPSSKSLLTEQTPKGVNSFHLRVPHIGLVLLDTTARFPGLTRTVPYRSGNLAPNRPVALTWSPPAPPSKGPTRAGKGLESREEGSPEGWGRSFRWFAKASPKTCWCLGTSRGRTPSRGLPGGGAYPPGSWAEVGGCLTPEVLHRRAWNVSESLNLILRWWRVPESAWTPRGMSESDLYFCLIILIISNIKIEFM